MFEAYTAAQYRALDADQFEARKNEVIDLMNADSLPEGVTDEMLYAEADMIEADAQRRSKANKLFNTKVAAVVNGAGNVVATTNNETRAAKHEVRDVTDVRGFTDSIEYRRALADHIMHRQCMSSDYMRKAIQERADISMNGDYTNMVDTITNTYESLVAVPHTLAQEIIREAREQSVILPLVNETHFQGMYSMSEADLQITGSWIGDKEVTDYQTDYDPEVFSWTWHQFEARHARTLLAEALMSDNYKSLLAPAFGECYANAMDAAVLKGNGTTQPRGIETDTRLVGTDGLGVASTAGGGKAVIVTVTEDDVDDWRFWVKLPYNPLFNRLYRGKGQLVMADGTWGSHIEVLRDDNNRPISKFNPLKETEAMTIAGIGNVATVANSVMADFDSASEGDIIGIYGNFKNYTMNFQPGMPINTVSWTDHETNTNKTKLLLACDGRVSNPFGWIILKKGPSA